MMVSVDKIGVPQECISQERITSQNSISLEGRLVYLQVTESLTEQDPPTERQWHCCLFCANYKTADLAVLVEHMQLLHPDVDGDTRLLDPLPVLKQFDATKITQRFIIINLQDVASEGSEALGVMELGLDCDDGQFECELCHKRFSQARYLKRHVERHQQNVNIYDCENCNKQFKSLLLLEAHIRKVHLKVVRQFQCKQCNFASTNTTSIHEHLQAHPEGAVTCTVCGQSYTDNGVLKKHMDVHDVSRPYVCTFAGCQWRFKTASRRDAHMRSHVPGGRFQCRFCHKAFGYRHHLTRHEVSLHGASAQPARRYDKARSSLLTSPEPCDEQAVEG